MDHYNEEFNFLFGVRATHTQFQNNPTRNGANNSQPQNGDNAQSRNPNKEDPPCGLHQDTSAALKSFVNNTYGSAASNNRQEGSLQSSTSASPHVDNSDPSTSDRDQKNSDPRKRQLVGENERLRRENARLWEVALQESTRSHLIGEFCMARLVRGDEQQLKHGAKLNRINQNLIMKKVYLDRSIENIEHAMLGESTWPLQLNPQLAEDIERFLAKSPNQSSKGKTIYYRHNNSPQYFF
ncbi:hypothetical protein DM02DRAFT_621240 [Periconia macrospinosa]|uniref:Uncharacterized protein n=1 Tax=Periconia macrospinosa TaxID=97972 RepID=A0A2V1EDD8_9PLEO|nr:hypothetical protein DM02DRAFT_621240 [Periconia macrospinosa]